MTLPSDCICALGSTLWLQLPLPYGFGFHHYGRCRKGVDPGANGCADHNEAAWTRTVKDAFMETIVPRSDLHGPVAAREGFHMAPRPGVEHPGLFATRRPEPLQFPGDGNQW